MREIKQIIKIHKDVFAATLREKKNYYTTKREVINDENYQKLHALETDKKI